MNDRPTPRKSTPTYTDAEKAQAPAREPTEEEQLVAEYAKNVTDLRFVVERMHEAQREEISAKNRYADLSRDANKLRDRQKAIHAKLEQLTR